MAIKQKVHVKVGDQVTILSGFYKNQTGTVTKVMKNKGKINIKNNNLKYKHLQPNTENKIGEIKQFEAPIHHSNVKLTLPEIS